jgi:tetratricopeptide (TPR) repeat protein
MQMMSPPASGLRWWLVGLLASTLWLFGCPTNPDIELEEQAKHVNDADKALLPSSGNTQAREHFLAGNEALNDKKYQQAIKRYSKALELDPRFADAYENRAVARMYLKEFYPALEDFAELLELRPDSATAYYNLGNAYITQAMFAAAIKSYKRSLELDKDQPGALNNLGNAYAGDNQLSQAQETFEEFIRRYKDNPEGYNNLGIVYEMRQLDSKAEETYRRALAVDAKHPAAYKNLAFLYKRLGRIAEAINHCESYLKLAPQGRGTDWTKTESECNEIKAKAGRF